MARKQKKGPQGEPAGLRMLDCNLSQSSMGARQWHVECLRDLSAQRLPAVGRQKFARERGDLVLVTGYMNRALLGRTSITSSLFPFVEDPTHFELLLDEMRYRFVVKH